jgi:hypothetical protein
MSNIVLLSLAEEIPFIYEDELWIGKGPKRVYVVRRISFNRVLFLCFQTSLKVQTMLSFA